MSGARVLNAAYMVDASTREFPPLDLYLEEPLAQINGSNPNAIVPLRKPTVPSRDAVAGEPIELIPLANIVAERREPEWLLHKILERNVMAVIAGPRGMQKPVAARIAAQVAELQATPRFTQTLRNALMEPMPLLSPDQTAAFVRAEYDRWKSVIKLSGAAE